MESVPQVCDAGYNLSMVGAGRMWGDWSPMRIRLGRPRRTEFPATGNALSDAQYVLDAQSVRGLGIYLATGEILSDARNSPRRGNAGVEEICGSQSWLRVAGLAARRRTGCASPGWDARRRADAGRGASRSGCCSLAVDGSLAFL